MDVFRLSVRQRWPFLADVAPEAPFKSSSRFGFDHYVERHSVLFANVYLKADPRVTKERAVLRGQWCDLCFAADDVVAVAMSYTKC